MRFKIDQAQQQVVELSRVQSYTAIIHSKATKEPRY